MDTRAKQLEHTFEDVQVPQPFTELGESALALVGGGVGEIIVG